MIDDSMKEIVNDFIQEALELLESLNENFIELEKQPDNKEILNTIFRAAHTVKGSAGFLGFQNIVELAHSAENILNKLRQGEISLTSEMTDELLKTMDILKSMIITVSETGSEGEPPEGNAELIGKLNALSEGLSSSIPAAVQPEVKKESLAVSETEASAPASAESPAAPAQNSDSLQASPAAGGTPSGKKKARSLGDILLEDNLISKEELEEIYKEKEEEERKEGKEKA
ncbi:MAG: Hpt domain-containing protein, partial [Deltaproteobacteria bacterium]|nr:Hpt domain-containing protein [Deltaproteobacteria bacterium]